MSAWERYVIRIIKRNQLWFNMKLLGTEHTRELTAAIVLWETNTAICSQNFEERTITAPTVVASRKSFCLGISSSSSGLSPFVFHVVLNRLVKCRKIRV